VVTDRPGLPRVLLIGDSISMGYTLPVRARLQGKANVHRPAENCSESANGVKRLDVWLGDKKWDVIHFNFGLHDVKYLDAAGKYVTPDKGKQVASVADYERNLRTIVARLKQTGAKLIFATTTPVPSASSGRVEHDELRYNEAAVRVMKELGVAVDDLHALVAPQQEKIQLPHNVHFTKEGYEALADQVVASIAPVLSSVAK
jgi:acyl-CoA thioesterase-1